VKDTSASSVVKGDAEVAAAAAAAAVAATQGKDKGKKKPADAEDAADGGADEAEEDASSANADEGIAPKKKNPFAEEMKKGFDELKGAHWWAGHGGFHGPEGPSRNRCQGGSGGEGREGVGPEGR
jgi:hypothetical protein